LLCHICNREAIGQCKNCFKFYCAEHGDVTCQVCARAVQTQVLEQPSPAPTAGRGSACYKCGGPAVFRCHCGRACCLDHHRHFGIARVCLECHRMSSRFNTVMLLLVLIGTVVFLIALAFARRQ